MVLGEPGADQVVDGAAQRDLGRVGAGAGVEQDGALVAEQQEDERRLEADRLADPQDESVPIAWWTWIAGSVHCLREAAPWIHSGSSAPSMGAPVAKSMSAGRAWEEEITSR
jgi:hypothetical protein